MNKLQLGSIFVRRLHLDFGISHKYLDGVKKAIDRWYKSLTLRGIMWTRSVSRQVAVRGCHHITKRTRVVHNHALTQNSLITLGTSVLELGSKLASLVSEWYTCH